ncbi:DUF6483 family protein [Gorillibacterium timonense]|uniref:DUF6483 family protein n=1 Tax=Gorillibacterium timonense TaxID=1689269 RepID=UPI00071CF43D|nr:DUF6483 family protein [Gorillibacterium timonense]
MFQRDYIVRMMQELTEMIATVSGLKKQHKQEQAFSAVDDLLGRFFRMNSKLLNALSEKDILAMFSANGFLEAEKVLTLSRVLREEGSLHESLGENEESVRRYLKGLLLSLGVSELEDTPSDFCKETVREIHATLRAYDLPASVQERLIAHYLKAGEFAKAEDCLFELADGEGPFVESDSAAAAGNRFYESLLERSPEELEQGGLPLEEVREGWAAYTARFGS